MDGFRAKKVENYTVDPDTGDITFHSSHGSTYKMNGISHGGF